MTRLLQAAEFFLIRIPLLPFNTVQQFHKITNRNSKSFIDELHRFYAEPLKQEAVFLASASFYEETKKWLSNPKNSSLKLPLTLYRYLIRMCTRCTPYGLFAGCTTGTITDNDSAFDLPDNFSYRKVKRLDMGYLSSLLNALIAIPEVRKQILFYPNDSIYNIGDSARYFEYQLSNQRRQYFISAFARNEFIDELLRISASGASIDELIKVLTDMEIAHDDASEFIETLINNQVLIPGLIPVISDPASNDFTSYFKELAPINQLLEKQDAGVDNYKEIAHLLENHFPEILAKAAVQVDLFYPDTQCNISNKAVESLLADLQQLMTFASDSANPDLIHFKEQFLKRYEQQEIPLMIALDSDIGIGYGLMSGGIASYTPLVDDLVMPAKATAKSLAWNNITQFVWQQFLEAKEADSSVITLEEADIKKLSENIPAVTIPAALTLMGTLIAESAAALDDDNYRFLLKTCTGPNALALLGRFGAGDQQLADHMSAFAKEEQANYPDKVFAEIIHLPEGRIGNVLLRPRIYDYEIHFLGKSNVATSYQIPVSDLYVSVRNNQVILRSKKLNKEIIPRLTSAHNFVRGLAIYKFLADLQQQSAISVHWNWGALLEQPFLPRVAYKHIILERARWYFSTEYYHQLLKEHAPEEAIQAWRHKYKVPATVLLSEGDNELLIDLDHEFALTILCDKVNKGDVVLYETTWDNDTNLLSNQLGSYCNEVIIPLRNHATASKLPVATKVQDDQIQRNFLPGSEWLYVKIYCGFGWIDKLLVNALYPLVQELQAIGMADRWFFIRYQDPDSHIRLRVHLSDPASQVGYVLQKIHGLLQSYLDASIVQRIQLDTYVRETERYDAHYMELSEQFFWHDSESVAYLLSTPGLESSDRWLLALKGVDTLLECAELSSMQKLQMAQQLQQQFFTEHGGNDDLMLQLNRKFREHRKQITEVLDNGNGHTLNIITAPIFERRSHSLIKTFSGPVPEFLLPHYLHMFLNRMFTANARMQELVIYHYLMKHYSSVVARS